MKKLNHKHLSFEEKMFFLLGVIDPEGNIIHKNVLNKKEHEDILKKLALCKECRKNAQLYYNYNLKNSENLEEKPIKLRNNRVLVSLFLFLFLLIFDFDFRDITPIKNLSLSTENQPPLSVEQQTQIKKINIIKNNKEKVGTIEINDGSTVNIRQKRLCKSKSVEFIDGQMVIQLNKNVPLCIGLNNKTLIIKNKSRHNEKIELSIYKNMNEKNESNYKVNIINGKPTILILPDYVEFNLDIDEVLNI
ncbi:MAG: hypothetical protein N2247_06270 [Leptospiraceae bacterium]|jgi:hypothetical protein|nr:hypothetical protein [Leptospiraceae bacterium]